MQASRSCQEPSTFTRAQLNCHAATLKLLIVHAGKRELPGALRSRFTELWVPEPSQQEDLEAVAAAYLQDCSPQPPVQQAVALYRAAKQAAVRSWADLMLAS